VSEPKENPRCYECGAEIPGAVVVRPKAPDWPIREGAPWLSVFRSEGGVLVFSFCCAEHAVKALPIVEATVI
jgi:hypothetical protein